MESAKGNNDAYADIFGYSCYTGDTTDLARLIVEDKFKVNGYFSQSNEQPLYSAIIMKSLPVATLLLDHGADPNADQGRTLNEVIYKKHLDFLRLLLEKGANPNIHGASSLANAVLANRADVVELLLDHGADVMLNNLIVFRLALIFAEPNILELLWDHTGRVMIDRTGEMNKAMKIVVQLCKAVLHNDVAEVGEILGTGFFADYSFNLGNFFLEGLVHRITDREVGKVFVREGVAIKYVYLLAVNQGDEELQELCLASPNFDSEALKVDSEILFEACRTNQLESIKLLVNKYGHKLDTGNSQGLSPLFVISKPNVWSGLVAAFPEIDLNITSNNSTTTLLQRQMNCENYVILLELGADPWFKNDKSLHFARAEIECDENPKCAVVQHLQKLSLIDLRYVENLLPAIFDMSIKDLKKLECPNLKKEYEEEILKMQGLRISQSTSEVKGKSLFHFILLEPNEAARYARNVEILKIYEAYYQDFKNYLPHYGFALNHQLRRAQTRRNRFETALEMLSVAIGFGLPEAFAELIFGYFSNLNLNRFEISEHELLMDFEGLSVSR